MLAITSCFILNDGRLDIKALREWTEDYFQNMMMFMNHSAPRDNLEEVIDTLSSLEFEPLVAMELEGEPREVQIAAAEMLVDLARRRIAQFAVYL